MATWIQKLLCIALLLTAGCNRRLSECEGPKLDTARLTALTKALYSTSAQGFLVRPNPIDATRNVMVQSTDPSLTGLGGFFSLPDLLAPGRLQSSYVRVFIKTPQDVISTLAKPDASGKYQYAVDDVHYSEVMSYFAIHTLIRYVEALGFKLTDSRVMDVMVRDTTGGETDEVNAYYSHNFADSTKNRTMRLIGDSKYAAAAEEDIPLHEMGHNRVELLNPKGIDRAGDAGGSYSVGAAIHEAIADLGSEAVRGRGYIGKWLARNFSEYQPGEPLRSADGVDRKKLTYREVAEFDGTEKNLDRYRLAEFITQALWDLRTQFAKEDSQTGLYYADRIIYTAVTLLNKDTSLTEFRNALETADDQLHCGLHSQSINQVFENRGFYKDIDKLPQPLQITGSSVTVDSSRNPVALAQATEVVFNFRIANIGSKTARNVRVYLESSDPALIKSVYMQGFGDVPAGATVNVGQSGLGYTFSVAADLDRSKITQGIRFTLRVTSENGVDSRVDGVIQ